MTAINSDFRVVLLSTILRVHSTSPVCKTLFQLKALLFQEAKGFLQHRVLSSEIRQIPMLKEISQTRLRIQHKMCLLKILFSAVFQDKHLRLVHNQNLKHLELTVHQGIKPWRVQRTTVLSRNRTLYSKIVLNSNKLELFQM